MPDPVIILDFAKHKVTTVGANSPEQRAMYAELARKSGTPVMAADAPAH